MAATASRNAAISLSAGLRGDTCSGRGPRAETLGRNACRRTADVTGTSFLAALGGDRQAGRGHQETGRFPSGSCRAPSHPFCVGTLDLASVSNILRSVSDSVRRTTASVSANLRRKLALIARRAVYDCAPLHIGRLGDLARHVRCCPAFPSASALGSTDSASGRPALFVGFSATMAESDFSRSCIGGYGSSPSRRGPDGHRPVVDREISRFPRKERPHMPGSPTTPGRPGARDGRAVQR